MLRGSCLGRESVALSIPSAQVLSVLNTCSLTPSIIKLLAVYASRSQFRVNLHTKMSKWLKFGFKWDLKRFGIQMGDKRLILASRAIFSHFFDFILLESVNRVIFLKKLTRMAFKRFLVSSLFK